MGDFLTFRRMVTPILIQVVYWIVTVVMIVGGLVVLVAAPGGTERALGLAVLVLGPLVVRVYAEVLLVVFRINETLTDIRNMKGQG